MISTKATHRIIHASHYSKMMTRVGRPLVAANFRPGDVLAKAKTQLDLELNHREDAALFLQMDNKNLKDHTFSTLISK